MNGIMARRTRRPSDLLEKVIPISGLWRRLIDNHWFKMLKRDNVDLITDAIDQIVPEGVRNDGRPRP